MGQGTRQIGLVTSGEEVPADLGINLDLQVAVPRGTRLFNKRAGVLPCILIAVHRSVEKHSSPLARKGLYGG